MNQANAYWRHRNNPAKAYLMRYRALLISLESAKRSTQELRDSLTSISAPLKDDPIKGSGVSDRMADTMARIVDAEAIFADTVEEIKVVLREIMEAIGSVPDDMQKAVLMLRYVEGLDWISVAERVYLSEARAYLIHSRALIAVNEWLKKREETIV